MTGPAHGSRSSTSDLPQREWLTVAAVAESEGVSPRTILRWIDAGHLQARRQPGGRLRVHVDWYREMVERGASSGRILAAAGDAGGD